MEKNYLQVLEELKTNNYGHALSLWLEEELEKIQDIHTIKTIKELQARQEVEKILKNLFRFINIKDKKSERTKYN